MKKLLLIALFLGSKNGFSQVDFFKTFGFPNSSEHLSQVEPAAEKGFFWAAGETSGGGQDDLFWVKMDSTGEVVWADTFGLADRNEQLMDFDRDPKTGEMWLTFFRNLAGNDEAFLIKLAADGQFLFEKKLDVFNGSGNGSHVRAFENGGGAVVATAIQALHRIFRIDSNGATIWQKDIPSDSYSNARQELSVAPNGSIFLVKTHGWPSQNATQTRVHALGPDGSEIWTDTSKIINAAGATQGLGSSGQSIFEAADSSVVVFAKLRADGETSDVLTKIDAKTGQIIWQTAKNQAYDLGRERGLVANGPFFAVIGETGFQLFKRSDGAFVSAHSFFKYVGLGSWPTRLFDGVLDGETSLFFVGENATVDFQTTDGQVLRVALPSVDTLVDRRIGQIGPSFNEWASAVAVGADGNFFTATSNVFPDAAGADLLFRKHAATTGEILFEKRLVGLLQEGGPALAALADGSVLIAAGAQTEFGTLPFQQFLLLKKMATDGSEIWEKKLPQPLGNSSILAAPMADGGAVVVFSRRLTLPSGQSFPNQLHAMRLSAAGDSIWSRRFLQDQTLNVASNKDRRFENLERLPDGSLVATGSDVFAKKSGFLIRFDPVLGQSAFETEIDSNQISVGEAQSAVLAAGGGLAVFTTNGCYRLAPDGSILLKKQLKFDGQPARFGRLVRKTDGSLAGVFSFYDVLAQKPGSFRYAELTEDFDVVSSIEIWPKNLWADHLATLADGAFALLGREQVKNSGDLFLLKTEPLALVSAFEKAAEKGFLRVSPNPLGASDFLKIELEDDSFFGPFRVEIWTLGGQLFSVFENQKTAAKEVFEIEKGLPSGAFFVRVLNEKSLSRTGFGGAGQKLVLRF